MSAHEFYMAKALELAKCGWGKTNPNPLVGAVIVKDGLVLSEGYHEALGCPHAEAAAFKNARHNIQGSTLYVNLEPCSHYGRTPPCARAIIDSGIKEVVVGMIDPNPKVSGKGIKMLQDAGINVITGILHEESKKLNEIFIKYITEKKPFVILKAAMTLDGKIASVSGDSKWISGESSRQYVHKLRDRVAAIIVGINTVEKDNPYLTARNSSKACKNPVRIIVDSKGRIPLESNVINISSNEGMILATTQSISEEKEYLLQKKGVRIIKADDGSGKVDLVRLMDELYKLELDSVLLEGGGTINYSALDAGIVDKVLMFIAPKILGGKTAVTPVEGSGRLLMKDAFHLRDVNVSTIENDVLIEGYPM
ncbi:MAG: bifunctional diaminohydroxyphosphoribosylaminopyrimidine deaminase/5-amino-6-(5-phosphoribosylamino)uracil reductase RibD [Clostridia bacterium]|nr:bifunctional diaminohydroxyphosphoribosylaminopyrimidine deaminase/5-amino-6-(5-phosphoribosylamino)uracil reductase RibD [Clostridia bacterium]